MDNLTIRDLLFVAFPENILSFVIILLLFKESVNKNKIKSIFTVLFSALIMITIVYISNKFISNRVITGFCSTLGYFFVTKIIIKLNKRKSAASALIAMFIIYSSETIMSGVVNYIASNIKYENVFDYRAILTSPMRVFQIFIAFIIYKFKIELSEYRLFNEKWSELDERSKVSCIYSLSMIFMVNTFSINFVDMYIKILEKQKDVSFLSFNITMFFIQTVVVLSAVLNSFHRTINYEEFSNILKQNSKVSFVKALSKKMSRKERIESIQVLQNDNDGI
ncbi:hypothetical protein [Petroclostridium sp. X23]|uniref:hypothetical protein n=1 Tax=Petroclostridium sp. X23 TaxID=3045146 RepID=UPI0024AC95B5|nr:hypothetical protein [Petroclostridium sp. X23]WHH59194.1 hypothetical protein QKW49_00030 [Petroclostridium sp. X23]